jgi:hypothetical protein
MEWKKQMTEDCGGKIVRVTLRTRLAHFGEKTPKVGRPVLVKRVQLLEQIADTVEC